METRLKNRHIAVIWPRSTIGKRTSMILSTCCTYLGTRAERQPWREYAMSSSTPERMVRLWLIPYFPNCFNKNTTILRRRCGWKFRTNGISNSNSSAQTNQTGLWWTQDLMCDLKSRSSKSHFLKMLSPRLIQLKLESWCLCIFGIYCRDNKLPLIRTHFNLQAALSLLCLLIFYFDFYVFFPWINARSSEYRCSHWILLLSLHYCTLVHYQFFSNGFRC
jgi:hypothetical protein